MTLRLKHLLGLGAGAVVSAGLALSASATSFQGAITDTYSAQTVFINSNNVAIPSGFVTGGGPIRYTTSSGQFAGAGAGAAGDTITFTALTAGATFAGTPVAVCTGCPATTSFTTTVSANAITVTVFSTALFPPFAFAVPPGATITLVASATPPPTGTALGPSVSLNGLPNLVPASLATATAGSPTVVLGTSSPTTNSFPASIPVGQVPNVIVALATCNAGAACTLFPTGDTNPVPVMQIVSVNSFSLSTSPVTQMIDLSGVGAPAGTQFQTVTAGAAATTPVGFLGTFTLLNNSSILDARFGNQCCNNSSHINGGNTPLAGTAAVTITGDFQTITNAYLRIGPTTSQGQQPVETQPSANGTCTTSTGGGDIISSPLPLASNPPATQLNFSVPTGTTTLPGASGASFVNTPVYAICVVTNGSNIIADTFTNSPGSTPAQVANGGAPGAGGIGGVIGSGGVFGSAGLGTNWTVTVSGPNFPNLVLARNTHPGFDIAYGGTKVVFTNVFAAQTGYATFIRLVNTGTGTYPVYAVIQKDGVGPAPIPGSFAAMTPFAAFYVSADAIAAQGGTILQGRSSTANTTMILLTPSSTFQASKLIQQPSGDVVISGPGL